MKPRDKNYLRLQFQNRIYKTNGTEFQTFFENIMEKAFPDFQKIKPNGRMGDGGNDGYQRNAGVFYQVYAPNTPKTNESKAATKLINDFRLLKRKWDAIIPIKEYHFVFNNKYEGSNQLLEAAISQLETEYTNIDFKLLLNNKLEEIFFHINKDDMLSIGFDIDERRMISVARDYLMNVEIQLDRECSQIALTILENGREIINELSDESLLLDYEILECRCFVKLERVDEAKRKYESISKRFPNDPRAYLYLAEIFLLASNYSKNMELLDIASKIDDDHWLLKLERLVRKSNLGENIDFNEIDEHSFPDDFRIKANFYRLYATFYEKHNNPTDADQFIEKAIHYNPERFINYLNKLTIIENRLLTGKLPLELIGEFLELIDKVEKKCLEYGEVSARNKIILNTIKYNVYHLRDSYSEMAEIAQETINLIYKCYFDRTIDNNINNILSFIFIPEAELHNLLKYLENATNDISDNLSKTLIFQFNINNTLFSDGKTFFKNISKSKYCDFISDIENTEYNKVLVFLKDDLHFAVIFANTIKNIPELRRKIIDNLPDNHENIQKDKLLFYLNYEEGNYDEAFKILKKIDLADLSYLECKNVLEIIHKKEAWDFAIIIINILLKKEKDGEQLFKLELMLLDSYNKLDKYKEVIEIGEKLIQQELLENRLDNNRKEKLLAITLQACGERGKLDRSYFEKAKIILEKYPLIQPSWDFKIGIESEVYLNIDDPDKALLSVIEGVKIKKVLTPEEYMKLYYLIAIQIGNQIQLNISSLSKIIDNTYIKLRNKDKWYYIGNDNELDAIKITHKNSIYKNFIDKEAGETIQFKEEYGSESRDEIVEIIFPIERYIFWQSKRYFEELSKDNIVAGLVRVEIPENEGKIDTTYLIKFLEDINKIPMQYFQMYCENIFPLAFLAVAEGGLATAIARIQRENRGFINFSTGTKQEIEKQKEIAQNVITNQMPFYIDGTSAII
ncbi:MAG: hypothetical protein EHM20_02125, partial [Alphaproteobacteria bacterium]